MVVCAEKEVGIEYEKISTKKRQNRHSPELAFLYLRTYFTAPRFLFLFYFLLPDRLCLNLFHNLADEFG